MLSRDYRRIARENLQGNWKISIGTALLASIMGGLVVGSDFLPELNINISNQNIQNLSDLFRVIIQNTDTTVEFTSALNLVHLILGGVIQMGYACFLLKQHDRANPELNDLFSQFHRFRDGLCMHLLRTLYIVLWSLLLIIPGIIATYNYAMAPYILLENPNMSASESLAASKRLMYGHRFDLFCLHLSFIGWDLLCLLTLNLGHIALNPYKCAAQTAFYRDICRYNTIY